MFSSDNMPSKNFMEWIKLHDEWPLPNHEVVICYKMTRDDDPTWRVAILKETQLASQSWDLSKEVYDVQWTYLPREEYEPIEL